MQIARLQSHVRLLNEPDETPRSRSSSGSRNHWTITLKNCAASKGPSSRSIFFQCRCLGHRAPLSAAYTQNQNVSFLTGKPFSRSRPPLNQKHNWPFLSELCSRSGHVHLQDQASCSMAVVGSSAACLLPCPSIVPFHALDPFSLGFRRCSRKTGSIFSWCSRKKGSIFLAFPEVF